MEKIELIEAMIFSWVYIPIVRWLLLCFLLQSQNSHSVTSKHSLCFPVFIEKRFGYRPVISIDAVPLLQLFF